MPKITIEHKYNIGDEVYFFEQDRNKILKGVIENVILKVSLMKTGGKYDPQRDTNKLYDVERNGYLISLSEDFIFKSIEDVAKSLYEGE